jgi:hypothetical protein
MSNMAYKRRELLILRGRRQTRDTGNIGHNTGRRQTRDTRNIGHNTGRRQTRDTGNIGHNTGRRQTRDTGNIGHNFGGISIAHLCSFPYCVCLFGFFVFVLCYVQCYQYLWFVFVPCYVQCYQCLWFVFVLCYVQCYQCLWFVWFGAVKSDSTHHFFGKCLYQVRVIAVFPVFRLLTDLVCFWLMSFDFPFGRLFGVR